MMQKVSIFDVDGTLSRGFYIVKFSNFLHEKKLFPENERNFMLSSLEDYKNNKRIDYTYEQFAWDLVDAFGRGIKGEKQSDIENAGEEYIKINSNEKFNFTDDVVKLVKDREYKTIVISGSPYEIIDKFAESLGIDETFATLYGTKERIFTGRVIENCALNTTKRQIILQYAKENDIDLKNSVGFGDSHHDLAFLGMVGYPIAMNPNENLEKIANMKKWLVCRENENVLDKIKSYLPQL